MRAIESGKNDLFIFHWKRLRTRLGRLLERSREDPALSPDAAATRVGGGVLLVLEFTALYRKGNAN